MAKMKGTIVVDTERCKGCELCAVACPLHIISMSEMVNHKGYHYAQQTGEDCTGCTSCAIVCPDGCISVYREGVKKPLSTKETTTPESVPASPENTAAAEGTNNQEGEVVLLKGNEAIAKAAYRYGYDGYFGYPITPQSEVLETLALDKPWETTGMVVLQAESELASINMVYAGGASGKCVMTSSSSPGVALMQEGLTYMAGAEIPGLVVNVTRGGPGLGTIQPSQADYRQAVYGGGNGDYHCIVLAPFSVQEMANHMGLAKELMFRWRNPVMILSDGMIGQMMEKVVLPPYHPRRTDEEIHQQCPWAANGLGLRQRKPNFLTSLDLVAERMEEHNIHLSEKYRQIEATEVRYEEYQTEDADVIMVAFGCCARICLSAMKKLRNEGMKVGLLRPITLWPFPEKRIAELAAQCKAMVTIEGSEGQMVRDVRYAVEGRCPVHFYGRSGGMIPSPAEVYEEIKKLGKTKQS